MFSWFNFNSIKNLQVYLEIIYSILIRINKIRKYYFKLYNKNPNIILIINTESFQKEIVITFSKRNQIKNGYLELIETIFILKYLTQANKNINLINITFVLFRINKEEYLVFCTKECNFKIDFKRDIFLSLCQDIRNSLLEIQKDISHANYKKEIELGIRKF